MDSQKILIIDDEAPIRHALRIFSNMKIILL
jgi:hypothetical protein